jgi:L-threonylcarbamoyladenylate synthase
VEHISQGRNIGVQTIVRQIDPDRPDTDILAELGDALRHGGLVAFPTETVYGLGANALDPLAVAAIFSAKGRPGNDPLIVHLADGEDIIRATGCNWDNLPSKAHLLAKTCWPGPLTLILPRGPLIPDNVTAGLSTVGVRVPDHPLARGLIAAAGVPLAAPSANIFGHTSPTTASHVLNDLDGRIQWILDGGPTSVGVESTILDITQSPPLLLRPGGLPIERLEEILNETIKQPSRAGNFINDNNTPSPAPGMLLTHYAPRTPLIVYAGNNPEQVWQRVISEISARRASLQVGALVPSEYISLADAAGASQIIDLGAQNDINAMAQHLYAGLRALDTANVDIIISGSPHRSGLGLAVHDRLWRATSGTIVTIEE